MNKFQLKGKEIIHEEIKEQQLIEPLNEIVFSDKIKILNIPREQNFCSKQIVEEDYLRSVFSKDNPRGVGNYKRIQVVENTICIRKIITHLANNYFKEHSIFLSGYYLYENQDSMAWHTNSDADGLRLYITYADQNNKSFFRYLNKHDKIITSYDFKGWQYRLFTVPEKKPHFWHCVYSECNRYSIGFRIYHNLINT